MTISQYLQILYNSLASDQNIYNFIIELFDNILDDEMDNPFEKYQPSTIYKFFKGSYNIPTKQIFKIYHNINLSKFYDYLSNFSDMKINNLILSLSLYNIEIRDNETFEEIGDLFVSILKKIIKTKQTNNEKIKISKLYKNTSFENDKMIINDKTISILYYSQNLFNQDILNKFYIFFTSISKKEINKISDFETLPKRLSNLFKKHQKFYSSYINIRKNIIDIFEDGENEIKVLENDFVDYIGKDINLILHNYNDYLKLFFQINNFSVSKSRLIKIKNLINEQTKIGLFYYLVSLKRINYNIKSLKQLN